MKLSIRLVDIPFAVIVTDFMADAPISNSVLHMRAFGNSAPMIQIFLLLFCGSLITAYILLKMAKTHRAKPSSNNFDNPIGKTYCEK